MNIGLILLARPNSGGVSNFVNTIIPPLRKKEYHVDIMTPYGSFSKLMIRDQWTQGITSELSDKPLIFLAMYIVAQCALFFVVFFKTMQRHYDLFFILGSPTAMRSLRVFQKRVPCILRIGGDCVADVLSRRLIRQGTWSHRFFIRQEREALEQADMVVPNSFQMKRHVLSVAHRSHVTEPLFNPVKDEFRVQTEEYRKRLREKNGLSFYDCIILCPALHLEYRKGPLLALQAMKRLCAQHKASLKMIFLGCGAQERVINEFVHDNHLDTHVCMKGVIAQDEMNLWYHIAHVSLFPMVPHCGGEDSLPNCILESMACGTPVISSKIGSMDSFIQNHHSGLLVPPGDVEAIVDAVNRLRDDKELYEKLSRNAATRIDQEHRWPVVMERWTRLFRDAIQKRESDCG